MVASTIQKLLRNQSQSAIRTIGGFPKSCTPSPSFVLPHVLQLTKTASRIPFPNLPKTEDLRSCPDVSSLFYPTFPFGFYVNSVSPALSLGWEADEDSGTLDDDSSIVRADSVKKKRKKKMNKHKLRKLRKRLRRKT